MSISANLQQVWQAIAAAAAQAGRDPATVLLLAVSKTFGPEAVIEAAGAGQRTLGNKATAKRAKAPMKRPASQKLIAFSGPLGVTSSGMPVYDKVCARSISPIDRKAQPSSKAWLLAGCRRRFQASAKTIAETAMEKSSSAVCNGR